MSSLMSLSPKWNNRETLCDQISRRASSGQGEGSIHGDGAIFLAEGNWEVNRLGDARMMIYQKHGHTVLFLNAFDEHLRIGKFSTLKIL